jgi:hypothetical protein
MSFLPASHLLSKGFEKVGDSPRASGGFADVWEGRYNGQMVAIKILKRNMTDDAQKVEKVRLPHLPPLIQYSMQTLQYRAFVKRF